MATPKLTEEEKLQRQQERMARQEAAGIPDSRTFNDPAAGPTRIEACHIQGVLVSDLNLSPHVLTALDYWATDEGIQEKNAQPNRVDPSGIKPGADEWNKALGQKRDDVTRRDFPMEFARDPLREVSEKYARPGMKAKFLSASKVKENSGTGDYQVVKDANGDPVRVRGLVLGHTPVERAEARNRHYREMGNQRLKQLTKQYKQEGGGTAVIE